jgi:hypothetical protein
MTPVPLSFRSFGAGPPGVVLVLVLSLALAACGGGSKKNTEGTKATTPQVLAVKTSVLKVGSVDVQSAGPVNPIAPVTGKAVLGIAQSYIDTAVFAPLKTGKLGAGYAALFDTGVRAAATGSDAAALTDLDVGKVENLKTTATPVHMSTLEGRLGETMYLATDFDLDMKAKGDAGPVRIHRHIELTFAPNAKKWLVTAYRVQAVRKSTAGTTTTTATGGTTP